MHNETPRLRFHPQPRRRAKALVMENIRQALQRVRPLSPSRGEASGHHGRSYTQEDL